MTNKNLTGLGSALTVLGLEDLFISNGELFKFPLMERGRITNDIIAEKLRLGRWKGVVRMMYGGFGKADALYEGDRDELREAIVRSATKHSKSVRFVGQETLDALGKAGENDLLFRLATNVPNLNYDDFNKVISCIDSSYFNDAEVGNQRSQKLHQTAANKAMNEEKYDSAFYHFKEAEDISGIARVFDVALSFEQKYYSGQLLEKIALSDPAQKDGRLKRIILNLISHKKGDHLVAFELYKKYDITLSSQEKKALQERVAESAERYNVERKLSDDPEVRLLWAKKHARDEPRTAYSIFTQQEFDGTEVIAAVQAGLGLEKYQNEERVLETSEVSKLHLRKAYKSAPFDVKIIIASHLKDSEELQKLSRQSHKKGDLDRAYRLWFSGGGNLDDEYIKGIRTALIENKIEKHYGYMTFLDSSDIIGMEEAYDTLMETRQGERNSNMGNAYEVALELGDEDRIQRVREEMFAISPEWAIRKFTSKTRGNDEKGLDYILGVVASECGANKGELRRIFEKYQSA